MNKLSILFLGALAGIMVACDDAPATALPQENEQGPVLEGITGATAAPTSTMTEGIDLQSLIDEGVTTLSLYTLNPGSTGVAQSDLSGYIEISASESFAKVYTLKPVDGVQGTVNVAELNEAYIEMFGKAPQTSTVYYRIPVYADVNGTVYRVGSLDTYGGSGTFAMTAPDPGFVIQDAYYLIGDVNGWSATQAALGEYKFSHSSSSVYDDPVFTVEIAPEGSCYFKIVPEDVYEAVGEPGFSPDDNNFWGLLIGAEKDGTTDPSGALVDTNAGSISVGPGTWTISINMEKWTYEINGTPAGMPDWFGTPNTFQDWNIANSMKLLLYGDTYKGFSFFGGEWGGKLGYILGSGEVWCGQDGDATHYDNDGDPYWEIPLSIGGGGNIFEGVDAKLYWITYTWNDENVYFREVTTCGIIGGFNDWGASVPMTAVEGSNNLKWTLDYTFDEDAEWKFRFNDGWTINLGGDLTGLVPDGGNINTAAGSYKIELDLTSTPYTATVTPAN